MQVTVAFEEDGAGGIIGEHLVHRGTEMVMERSAFPYAHMSSASLIELIDTGLYDDRDTLHKEDTAKDRNE